MPCSNRALAFLYLVLALLTLASLSIGSTPYTLLDILRGSAPRAIAELRVARSLAALSTGVILGAAGLALQYSLRNPLADPYLLGVSPAAYLAVVAYALIAPSIAAYYESLAPAAVAGGLTGLALVLLLSRLAVDTSTVILAGVAVATSFSGAAFALEYIAYSRLGWNPAYALFGGFAGVLPRDAMIVLMVAILEAAILLYTAPRLETLLYGDTVALLTGYEPRYSRLAALVSSGVAVAIQTGSTGVIGFVGLIAPNVARRLLDCTEARRILAAAMAVGGIVTLAADIASRLIGRASSLGEVPAGAMIALAGGVFLAALLARG